MSANFPIKSDLPKTDQAEIDRISAIPSGRRTSTESAYLTARTVYLTNEIIETDSSGNITLCRGNTVPSNGLSGFAKGATFIKLDAGASVNGSYTNIGTTSSCEFVLGSGSGGTMSHESPSSGAINGSNTLFVFTNDIGILTLNGQVQKDGTDVTISPANTATFVTAPGPGSTIENYYLS